MSSTIGQRQMVRLKQGVTQKDDINVDLGWRPDSVEIINYSDGGSRVIAVDPMGVYRKGTATTTAGETNFQSESDADTDKDTNPDRVGYSATSDTAAPNGGIKIAPEEATDASRTTGLTVAQGVKFEDWGFKLGTDSTWNTTNADVVCFAYRSFLRPFEFDLSTAPARPAGFGTGETSSITIDANLNQTVADKRSREGTIVVTADT